MAFLPALLAAAGPEAAAGTAEAAGTAGATEAGVGAGLSGSLPMLQKAASLGSMLQTPPIPSSGGLPGSQPQVIRRPIGRMF
jgi:hypothetical protein